MSYRDEAFVTVECATLLVNTVKITPLGGSFLVAINFHRILATSIEIMNEISQIVF